MFKFKKKRVEENSIKYSFYQGKKCLNYRDFLDNLISEDKEFLEEFLNSLNDATKELSNYFWECVPVSQETIDKRFEFVVTKSVALENNEKNKKQEFSTFREHLKDAKNKDAVSFCNLGKDALLIVPTPKKNRQKHINYKNISQFVTNSNKFPEQQVNFWKEVALNFDHSLGRFKKNTPLWLSTDGTGVNYLHVRIDLSPKYYSWSDYLKEDYATKEEEKDREFPEKTNESATNNFPKKTKFNRNYSALALLIFLSSISLSWFLKR
ncbi:MAG: hypothetical protein GBAus27B_000552 [Mycoplasmataceae bacterium]|nr:MAG: hypothetical protein GBAus27B_000552 [Mycoplasmataceae bacterium]